MSSSTKTITNLQHMPIYSEPTFHRLSRKQAIIFSEGDLELFGQIINEARRSFRNGFSSKKLKQYGYIGFNTITSESYENIKAVNYIAGTVGHSNPSINYILKKDGTSIRNIVFSLLKVASGLRTFNGELYQYISSTDTGTVIEAKFARLSNRTITNYLVANYGYNSGSTTVVIDGVAYNVPNLNVVSTTNSGGAYSVLFTQVADTTLTTTLIVPFEYLTTDLNRYLIGKTVLVISYVSGGKGYIHVTTTTYNIAVTNTVEGTPIIPIKSNGLTNPQNMNLHKTLQNLGMSYNGLQDTLSATALKSAFIQYGVDIRTPNPVSKRLLYKYFDSKPSGTLIDRVSQNDLVSTYTYKLSKRNNIGGKIGSVGTTAIYILSNYTIYENTFDVGEVVSDVRIRYQTSPTTYNQLTLEGLSIEVQISTAKFRLTANDTGELVRFPVNLKDVQSLKFKDFETFHESSLMLTAYSSQTTKVKWYQTGLFKIIMIIIIVVIAIYTGVDLTTTLTNFLTAFAVSGLVELAVESGLISEDFSLVLQAVIAIAAGGVSGTGGLLQVGVKLGELGLQYQVKELQEKVKEFDMDLDEFNKEFEQLKADSGYDFDSERIDTAEIMRQWAEYKILQELSGDDAEYLLHGDINNTLI